MKRGTGSNSFDNDELARYYNDYENCVWCNENGADCFDHVIPRANKYANSILNASPTHNHKCNIAKHGEMHTRENQLYMIKKNARRLHYAGYKLNQNDINFIKEYDLIEIFAEIV